MRGGLRASLVGLLSLGCYLSHARPDDAGPVSIDARDAGPDAPLDAPLPRCERIVIGETAALDGEALGSVTPRLVGLPDGSVGVVSVRTDGAPTRVLYEVRDAALRALEPSRTLATDSFTWAELTRVDERVVAGFGLGDGRSALQDVAAGRLTVALEHPSLLFALGRGTLWANFDSRSTNALVVAEVDRMGVVVSGPERIELGRYGSGHSAAVAPDGRRAVLGYPREEGRGVRRGFVRGYDDGVLGPERMLDEGDVRIVRALVRGDELVVVWSGDRFGLEHDDWATLEPLSRRVLPALDGTFEAGAIGERTIVARFALGRLVIEVYDADFELESTDDAAMPGSLGAGTAITSVPGGLVVAVGIADGMTTYPWLARIECAE